MAKRKIEQTEESQVDFLEADIELIQLDSVIGSGFETQVAELALLDGVAYRAARKNMQIHSAVILKMAGEFAGFFTFQINHDVGEFCLLQSAMYPEKKSKKIYSMMIQKIIEQNTFGYPMVMTVSRKHDLERPDVFHKLGFKTYLVKSDFEYIVYGEFSQVRMKLLAHIALTNLWNSTKGEWMQIKKDWNAQIESAGERHGIPNPKFASREGCWQGKAGFANVVLSKQSVEDGEVLTDSSLCRN